MDFVEVVKNKIKKNGLKQIFLAYKIGLAIDSFSKSLKGQRKFKTDEIFKLANILNIDLNQFKEA